ADDLVEPQRAARLLDALELRDVRRPGMLEHAGVPPNQYSPAVVQLETLAKRARERVPGHRLRREHADDRPRTPQPLHIERRRGPFDPAQDHFSGLAPFLA